MDQNEPDDDQIVPLNLSDTDLSGCFTDDLINELLKRDQAVVIASLRQDETTGADEFLVGHFYRGQPMQCLYATVKVMNTLIAQALARGLTVEDIVYMLNGVVVPGLTDQEEDDQDEDYGDMGPYPNAPQG